MAFKILIPIGCLALIAARLFFGGSWREFGIKLILFALMIFAIVPSSTIVTEKIDESYKASMQQMIEDARQDAAEVQDTAGNEEDDGILEKLFSKVQGGVKGTLDKFENTLNKLTETIAVLIVTSCVIPIAVLVFFLWLTKLINGVSLQLPDGRLSRKFGKFGKLD